MCASIAYTASSDARRLTATLNPAGYACSVERRWIQSLRVSEICTGVLAAARLDGSRREHYAVPAWEARQAAVSEPHGRGCASGEIHQRRAQRHATVPHTEAVSEGSMLPHVVSIDHQCQCVCRTAVHTFTY